MVVAAGTGTASFARLDRFAGARMTPEAAHDAVRPGEILLVDIRRPDDSARTGIPEAAHAIDLRRADFVETVAKLAGSDRTRHLALICAASVRFDRTGAKLSEADFTV